MSLGLRDPYEKRKRARRWAVLRALLLLGSIALAAWIAYGAGRQVGQARIELLQQQLSESRNQLETLQTENARLATAVDQAQENEAQWQSRYDRDVPSGELATLLEQARTRLEEGVGLERLAFVIEAVESERECRQEPVTRRFLVRTPLHGGGNDVASFADGLFTVSASGSTATDPEGSPQAWFDPAGTIEVTVTKLGGEEAVFDGELPLHFSVVEDGTEHLFTARPDDSRGFLSVTHDLCAFP